MTKPIKKATNKKVLPKNSILKRIAIFCILLINLLVYYPSIRCGFVDWDDSVYVTENPNIKLNSTNITNSFTKGETHGVYTPLTALSLSMNYSQSGLNPKPYHVTNIILHLLSVLLVFLFLYALTNQLLFTSIVTLFFSIHPAQIETVTYIAGRRDLLFSLFAMASMLIYTKYRKRESTQLYLFSILCFLLSLLSKTQALLLPFLLFVIDYFMGKKMELKKSLIEKAPFFILSIIFGVIAVSVKQASPDFKITDEVLQIPFAERLLYGIYGFCIYIYQSLIPVHLSLIHPYPSSMPMMAYFAIIPILALGFWAYKLYKKNQKTLLFGFLFFTLNIGLMLQFFPNSYGLINDHYLYLPLIGVGILIAKYATEVSLKYRNITLTFIGLYIGILAISGFNRIDVFSNPINVNTDVIEKYPDSYVAYNNRGTAYYKKNTLENALRDLNQAILLNPKSAFSLNNRSVISMSIGKFDMALLDLNQAISIKPDYADAYSNRAIAKSYINDSSALSDHNKAIGLNPHQPKYYYNRGAFYLQHNQGDLGCRDIQQSRQLGMKQGNPMVDRLCP